VELDRNATSVITPSLMDGWRMAANAALSRTPPMSMARGTGAIVTQCKRVRVLKT
jgi:hypothetical protein